MVDSLLVPLGHCLGGLHDHPAGGPPTVQVRLGTRLHLLSPPEFATWSQAHAGPRPPGDLDPLAERGLLVQVRPGTPAAVALARRVRLVPLLVGLGNTAEQPEVYRVGLLGLPLLGLSAGAYDLYCWSVTHPDLWSACEQGPDPEALLTATWRSLSALLTPNAAYLDLAAPTSQSG